MASFSFSFSGDDIEEDHRTAPNQDVDGGGVAQSSSSQPPSQTSAFPIQGKPLLPPVHHDLHDMLNALPSKIAYGVLDVDLDGRGTTQIPRRELWDVRVQLMAEADDAEDGQELAPGLGKHDVKTGIYEGGFKSWESSIDLVKVLSSDHLPPDCNLNAAPARVIELGCGTALPSVALFQWAATTRLSAGKFPLSITLADYNPSVLYLVTLPNFLLAWALQLRPLVPALEQAFETEGELELTQDVKEAFVDFLQSSQISLTFVSGAWSAEFVDLLYSPAISPTSLADAATLILGAETIYSPFALSAFAETLLKILRRDRQERPAHRSAAVVAAKRLYFGVGGSLDDFVDKMRNSGAVVTELREEDEGVRRGVVQCLLDS